MKMHTFPVPTLQGFVGHLHGLATDRSHQHFVRFRGRWSAFHVRTLQQVRIRRGVCRIWALIYSQLVFLFASFWAGSPFQEELIDWPVVFRRRVRTRFDGHMFERSLRVDEPKNWLWKMTSRSIFNYWEKSFHFAYICIVI